VSSALAGLRIAVLIGLAMGVAQSARAAEWFVSPGGVGNGTGSFPFGRIQDAINAAAAGDVVIVAPGTYNETLETVRDGAFNAPITLRAALPRAVVVTRSGRVLTVAHAYFAVDGFVLDGQYGADDTVRVTSSGNFLELRATEVRRSSRDLIDLASPQGVTIEGCLLHHALNAAGGRTDAHGVVGSAVRNLTIRGTEIHTFSGDGLQLDPDRAAPGWDLVTVEGSTIWLAPLEVAENGFAAGVVPGENAIDTKQSSDHTRSRLLVRDTIAYGFRGGLINNMAAFNLKEYVDVTVDGVTVYDSEIAFRLRGPGSGARVLLKNAVVHDVVTAFRYEDNIQNLRIWNSTVGRNVTRTFQSVTPMATLDVRNLLSVPALTPEAAASSNVRAPLTAFADAAIHDYHLAAGSPAVNAGARIVEVAADRDGISRPQGEAWDVGAYEMPEGLAGRAGRAGKR
jgi:hypothetical protein